MKKNIVIIYFGDDWNKKIPLQKSIPTREAFEDWHDRGQKNSIEMYRASIDWYDYKKNVFIKAWAYRQEKWVKIEKPIKPHMIYDKTAGKYDYTLFDLKMRLTKKTKVFNHPIFRTMTNNKLAQYLILGDFMPKSFLATDKNNFTQALKKISTKKVVVKPIYGSGGFGIIIDEKSNIFKKNLKIEYPVFIQEFIESTKGIPGFSEKKEISDLRMIFINHKLIYALSRRAKDGSLFTNFHQGARVILVPKKLIPKSALKTAKKITRKLSVFPEAHYSLDFMFTNSGKPLLVEMNTTPGFDLLHLIGTEGIKKDNFDQLTNIIN